MPPTVDCVLDARAEIGEGAVWDDRDQVLWWVDIPAGLVNRFDPATGANRSWDMGAQVGCAALTDSGRVVAALTTGFHELDPATGDVVRLCGPEPGTRGHRFNDGSVDPAGRFVTGTMPLDGPTDEDTTGTLYALNSDLAVNEIMSGFHTQNGLAFSPDGRTAYVSDSYPSVRTIWVFDYDLADGAWRNRRVFFDTRVVAGRPDGGSLDSDGCYWMAGVGGWQLVRITPAGAVDMIIAMPVERPSRIAFGGRDFATLYVTTLAGLTAGTDQPQAGGIFALTVPGVQGLPLPRMRR